MYSSHGILFVSVYNPSAHYLWANYFEIYTVIDNNAWRWRFYNFMII